MASIEFKRVKKQYRGSKKPALSDLSFSVSEGEVYGLLGANGAGKSTAIRMMLDFIRPTTGTILLNKLDANKDSVQLKRSIGYISGDVSLYENMKGVQLLSYLAKLHDKKISSSYMAELKTIFDAQLNKPIKQLSKGNKQKIAIIQAFMHQPDILLLDEPTSGLDPLMQEMFAKELSKSKARGAAILLSSHNFSEAQDLCDTIGFIKDGKMVGQQSVSSLLHGNIFSYRIVFAAKAPITALKSLNIAVESHSDNDVTIEGSGDINPLIMLLARNRILSIKSNDNILEDAFMKYYHQTGADQS